MFKQQIQDNIQEIQVFKVAFKEGKGWNERQDNRTVWTPGGLYDLGLIWNGYLRKDIII
ncbi:hypothetical protein KAX02_04455 [candidate division WOR-3 bacterium]|nr:hypothetical protein [candidate division WOR-3 bacterium]